MLRREPHFIEINRQSSASRAALPSPEAVCPVCERPGVLGERCAAHDRFRVSAADVAEAPRANLLGEMIDGKYAVLGLLGSGAVGTVYWGIQHPIGRRVAIKVLRSELTVGDAERERFLREARSLARLNSGQVVACYDYGFTRTRVAYMALEFVEGLTLEQVLERAELEVAEAVWLARRMLEGVAAFHQHEGGLVHRDLKPSNIMLCRAAGAGSAEVVKIIDFGLVRHLGDNAETLTHHGAILGTPLYMSPEQALGQADIHQASDVYAVGVMLYEMLTGHPPFQGETVMDVMLGHVQRRAPTIRNRRVPTRLKAFVAQCLAKDPDARYPDAVAALHALTALGLPERELFTEASPRETAALDTLQAQVPRARSIDLDVDDAFLSRVRLTGSELAAVRHSRELEAMAEPDDLARRWGALLGETLGALWSWVAGVVTGSRPWRWASNTGQRATLGALDRLAAGRAGGAAGRLRRFFERHPALSATLGLVFAAIGGVVLTLARLGRWVVEGIFGRGLAGERGSKPKRIVATRRWGESLRERPLGWTPAHRLRARHPWLALPIGLVAVVVSAVARGARRLRMEARGLAEQYRDAHLRVASRLSERLDVAARERRIPRGPWRRHGHLVERHLGAVLMWIDLALLLAALVGLGFAARALVAWALASGWLGA